MKIIKLFIFILLIIIVSLSGFLWGTYTYFSQNLPSVSALKNYRPKTVTTFYADDGTVIAEIFTEKRKVVPINKIPRRLVEAFVAAEDANFFTHKGIDYKGILRALYKNLEAGEIIQGGSTITQQVAKSFLLTPERSYTRKIKEAILAYRIDAHFSKDEILQLYLSYAPFGGNVEGIASAAYIYFNRAPHELSLAQAVTLIIIPNNPNGLRIDRNAVKTKLQRDKWLKKFDAERIFPHDQIAGALTENLKPRRYAVPNAAPHFCNLISAKVRSDTIKTTLRLKEQQLTEKLLKKYIERSRQKRIINEINNQPIEVYFCPRDNCSLHLIELINSAEQSVHCALFDIDLKKIILPVELVIRATC